MASWSWRLATAGSSRRTNRRSSATTRRCGSRDSGTGWTTRPSSSRCSSRSASRTSRCGAGRSTTDRARFGVHNERGTESLDLMFRMLGGHDRVHLAQARAALAARPGDPRLAATGGVALEELAHGDPGRRPLGLIAEDVGVGTEATELGHRGDQGVVRHLALPAALDLAGDEVVADDVERRRPAIDPQPIALAQALEPLVVADGMAIVLRLMADEVDAQARVVEALEAAVVAGRSCSRSGSSGARRRRAAARRTSARSADRRWRPAGRQASRTGDRRGSRVSGGRATTEGWRTPTARGHPTIGLGAPSISHVSPLSSGAWPPCPAPTSSTSRTSPASG